MSSYVVIGETAVFAESRQRFDETVAWLIDPQADRLSHADLEQRVQVAGRELLRQLLQDHFDLRAVREERLQAVTGDDAVVRTHAERGHVRTLTRRRWSPPLLNRLRQVSEPNSRLANPRKQVAGEWRVVPTMRLTGIPLSLW